MTAHLNISRGLNLLIHHVLMGGRGKRKLVFKLSTLLIVNCIAFMLAKFMVHSI